MPGDDTFKVRLGRGTAQQDVSVHRLEVGAGIDTVDLSPPLATQRRRGLPDEVTFEGKHADQRRAPVEPADVMFCSTDDPAREVGLRIRSYGAPHGRWATTALTYSVDPTGGNLGTAAVPVLAAAFAQWQAATRLTFTAVAVGSGHIRVGFGGSAADPRFGAAGAVLAVGEYPPSGTIRFDTAETWSAGGGPGTQDLLAVALHEIGHALGLTHSDVTGATMCPQGHPGQGRRRRVPGRRPGPVRLAGAAAAHRPGDHRPARSGAGQPGRPVQPHRLDLHGVDGAPR